jgi:hypothetical protein
MVDHLRRRPPVSQGSNAGVPTGSGRTERIGGRPPIIVIGEKTDTATSVRVRR